jgi:hypothetical protein
VCDSVPNWATLNPGTKQTTQAVAHVGYTAEDVIPIEAISEDQGVVTIKFKIKWNTYGDKCNAGYFEYSTDNGNTWKTPPGGDACECLSAGWTDNSGSGYTAAQLYALAEEGSVIFNTRHDSVSADFPLESNDSVRVRLRAVYDGESSGVATSIMFTVINPSLSLDPSLTANAYKNLNLKAYPNPFSTSVFFEIRNAKSELRNMDIGVYDITGKLVYLFDHRGSHSAFRSSGYAWHAQDQPNGIYLVKVRAGTRVLEKKIILIK